MDGVRAHDSVERLVQFLHVYERAKWMGIDPVYSLVRRDAAAKTSLLSPYRFGDFIYSCEMALQGTFVHVPAVLGHRRIAEAIPSTDALRRFAARDNWTRYFQREVASIKVWEAAGAAGGGSRLPAARALLGYAFREHVDGARGRVRNLFRNG